jgi:hypothetical protein
MMRRAFVPVPFLVAIVLAAGLAGSAAAKPLAGAEQGGRPLTTTLTGAVEVPVPGDPDGAGTARLTLNAGREQVCYELVVSGIAPATAAHVHEAPAGSAGGVVVGLEAPADGSSTGCVHLDRSEILDILRDPENYYVNVHNAAFPGGALRGQLGR